MAIPENVNEAGLVPLRPHSGPGRQRRHRRPRGQPQPGTGRVRSPDRRRGGRRRHRDGRRRHARPTSGSRADRRSRRTPWSPMTCSDATDRPSWCWSPAEVISMPTLAPTAPTSWWSPTLYSQAPSRRTAATAWPRTIQRPRDSVMERAIDDARRAIDDARRAIDTDASTADAQSTIDAVERRIAAGLLAGNRDALADAFSTWGAMVHAFCTSRVGHDAADDLTQQVFVAAWRSRTTFDPDRGVVPGWLIGIARNLTNRSFRGVREIPTATPVAEGVGTPARRGARRRRGRRRRGRPPPAGPGAATPVPRPAPDPRTRLPRGTHPTGGLGPTRDAAGHRQEPPATGPAATPAACWEVRHDAPTTAPESPTKNWSPWHVDGMDDLATGRRRPCRQPVGRHRGRGLCR